MYTEQKNTNLKVNNPLEIDRRYFICAYYLMVPFIDCGLREGAQLSLVIQVISGPHVGS